MSQTLLWVPEFRVYKRTTGELLISKGNLITTAGMTRLTGLISSDTPPQSLSSTATRVGVGDDDESESISDTALSTGADQWYEVPNSVDVVDNSIRYEMTFGVGVANFTWACWGLDVDDTPPAVAGNTPLDLFNRKVFNFGVKDGDEWDITMILTLVG